MKAFCKKRAKGRARNPPGIRKLKWERERPSWGKGVLRERTSGKEGRTSPGKVLSNGGDKKPKPSGRRVEENSHPWGRGRGKKIKSVRPNSHAWGVKKAKATK